MTPSPSPFNWQGPAILGPSFHGQKRALVVEQPKHPPAPKAAVRTYIRPLMPKNEKKSAGHQVQVDMVRLRELRALGWGIRRVAREMGHGPQTIVDRLLMMEGRK